MDVVVPHTDKLHPDVVPAIEADGHHARLYDVSGSDVAYWAVLSALWHRGRLEPIVIVEHDILVSAGMIAELAACPEDWCAHSYPVFWGDIADVYGGPYGLGLSKFSPALIERFPELLTRDVPTYTNPEAFAGAEDGRHWGLLDSAVSQFLKGPYRVQVHQHFPNVTHLHDYQRA